MTNLNIVNGNIVNGSLTMLAAQVIMTVICNAVQQVLTNLHVVGQGAQGAVKVENDNRDKRTCHRICHAEWTQSQASKWSTDTCDALEAFDFGFGYKTGRTHIKPGDAQTMKPSLTLT